VKLNSDDRLVPRLRIRGIISLLPNCGLYYVVVFFKTFKYLYYVASDGRVTDELRRIWKDQFVAQLMNYSSIFLERLRNTYHKRASGPAEIQTKHLPNTNTFIEQWFLKCCPRTEGVYEVWTGRPRLFIFVHIIILIFY
jgi:hypothetical protein